MWLENKDSLTVEKLPMATQLCDCRALLVWCGVNWRTQYVQAHESDGYMVWSVCAGLRHHADADMLLKRIAKGQDIQWPARACEIHWTSTVLRAQLGESGTQLNLRHFIQPIWASNRFVDALPVESYAVYEMQDLVNEVATGNQQALEQLGKEHYHQAKAAALKQAKLSSQVMYLR